jgi:regulator of protease activity HflC (stomatin/prohibitin superfamily)
MYLMFFGLVVLVVGLSIMLLRTPGAPGYRVTLFRLLGAAVTVTGVLLTLSTGFTVIGVGETGVVHAFGRVDPAPVVSGMHLIRPWASVEKFRVREIQFPSAGATEAMDALSREQMAVDVEVAVRYQIRSEDVVDLYKRIGDHDAVESAVLNAIRAGVRDGMARRTIGEIQFRDSIAADMTRSVQEKLISREPTPIHIAYVTQLFLRKITPPGTVAQAINQKIAQEQQVQTEGFKVQVEEQKARQRVTEARGVADAQRIINQTLSPQLLMREYITSLVKVSESNAATILIPTEGGLPLLDMGQFNRRVRAGGQQ